VRASLALLVSTFLGCLFFAASAAAQSSAETSGGASPSTGQTAGRGPHGGAQYGGAPAQLAPGDRAILLPDGTAAAPATAPPQVQLAIAAANQIIRKPYKYGGGHGRFRDTGYDCSGTISYALHGGGLLKRPLDSSSFMRWGDPGPGQWITVYTNPGHAYVVIAGLRLDTSTAGERTRGVLPGRGPRWRATARAMRGFRARHPAGL